MANLKSPAKQATVVIDKHSSNEEIMAAFSQAVATGKPILYATEDHGIDGQSWGYFFQAAPPDPISGLSKTPRRCAMAISAEKLESGDLAVGQVVKAPGATIARELLLTETKATSPVQNRSGEQLTSKGMPVYARFFLGVGVQDISNNIVIDSGRGGKVAQ